jgi:hypothetical protein
MEDLLTFDSLLMPGQVTALFGAAQQVDGVTMHAGVVDPWGRPAVSLSHVIDYADGSGEHEVVWFFDPESLQFLGGSGTVVELSGFVDSDRERPRGQDAFIPEPVDP